MISHIIRIGRHNLEHLKYYEFYTDKSDKAFQYNKDISNLDTSKAGTFIHIGIYILTDIHNMKSWEQGKGVYGQS